MSELLSISDEELALLDGRCSAATQKAVDAARNRLAMAARLPDCSLEIAGLVADAVRVATSEGRLTFETRRLAHCKLCNTDAGYAKYKRDGNWHRKGSPNYNKPLYITGVELRGGFIQIQGRVRLGCCRPCFEKARPHLVEALADVRAQIPEGITGHAPRLLRFDNVACSECGWTGHEGEMRQLPAIMQGSYPGGCPKCPAENRLFGKRMLNPCDGFTVVSASTNTKESR